MRADGSGLHRIQALTREAAAVLDPLRWSPDGSKLAYDRYSVDECRSSAVVQPRLTITSVDDERATDIALPLSKFQEQVELVDWSPDGSRLLYVDVSGCHVRDPFTYLDTIGVDGRGQRTLVSEAAIRTAAWSRDSRRIAYVDCGHIVISCELGLINSDGTGHRPLDTQHVPLSPPPLIWAPNGNEILANLYLKAKGESTGLVAVNAQTRRHRLVYRDGAYVYGFSPDGRNAVIASGQLFAVPLTGKAATPLGSPPVPKGTEWGRDSLYLR